MENKTNTPMTTEMAFDAMEQLLRPLSNVLTDVEIREMVAYAKSEAGRSAPAKDLMMNMLPLFVTRHRDDVVQIVAAIRGITAEEAKGIPFGDTLDTLKGCFVEEMLLFFMLCLRMVSVL